MASSNEPSFISEPAAKHQQVVDEAMDAGVAADHPVTVAAKMLRLELLKVKADLERELGTFVLNCSAIRSTFGRILRPIGVLKANTWWTRRP